MPRAVADAGRDGGDVTAHRGRVAFQLREDDDRRVDGQADQAHQADDDLEPERIAESPHRQQPKAGRKPRHGEDDRAQPKRVEAQHHRDDQKHDDQADIGHQVADGRVAFGAFAAEFQAVAGRQPQVLPGQRLPDARLHGRRQHVGTQIRFDGIDAFALPARYDTGRGLEFQLSEGRHVQHAVRRQPRQVQAVEILG